MKNNVESILVSLFDVSSTEMSVSYSKQEYYNPITLTLLLVLMAKWPCGHAAGRVQ